MGDMIHDKVLDSAVRHGYAILEFCNLGNSKLPHIMNVMKIFGKYLHEILIDICMIVKWNLTKAFYYKPLV